MMMNLGVYGKPCYKHNPNTIEKICLAPNCQHRILCKDCLANHNSLHQNQMKSIMDIFVLNVDEELKKSSSQLGEKANKKQKMLDKLDSVIDLLKEKVNTYLDKVKQQTIKEINQEIGLPSTNVDDLKVKISDKAQECVQFNENHEDIVTKLRTQHADLLAELANVTSKAD
mmetsp:Transcript_9276/g.8132  ORF Transcript_9276/g.8132 Transcript_9276/m.8132 type:complete len:171 (-) Transcript_9276:418-930(-)